ncbi:amylosucrase [Nocardioides exalbidus]|uniref:Amylosucrase n=2 Tax=Nocardioides exalbidus TaxID=402596 RepID=A0A1H4K2E9_9ACTN|nr:amylosucrase [Nocardioides exalbidus]SEB52466.1 amylosucrase [Nocardioides exalbidus]
MLPSDVDFENRLRRLLPDLRETLGRVYGADAVPGVADRLVAIARAAHEARPTELRDLDLRRGYAPDWFQREGMLGYAAYADRFGGTLAGVAERAPYLRQLGVGYLHLMPLLTPRPAPNDGGYAVMDYRSVRPDLGTTDDLRDLATVLRSQGISLCLDLVLNHVAREHEWAVAARAGDADKRAYFLVYDDRATPDAFEVTLPEVFPDFAPGSFTWDDELAGWVWTTFNDYQWDVDWSNPAVLCEYAAIILELANLGVEVFRLDAIAFIWKRLGTDCQNQPEVHELTRALRTVARIAAPSVLFKAEAIVGPADLPAYLGVGPHAGKVSDLAYHNGLMVQVWSMLAARDVRLASHALQQVPQPPGTTSWVTYVRCHDDIGWAIADEDAWALGIDPVAHRRFLSDWYSGSFPGSWARGLVFQQNDVTGDRRISGSLASLAGLEADDPGAVPRILLAHAIVLSFGGLPVLWMGDEIGLPNDLGFVDDPAHAADNRWVHRPRMAWSEADADPHGITSGLRHLVDVRRSLPQLAATVPTEVWDPRDPRVLLVVRRHSDGPLLAAANVSDEEAWVDADVLHWLGLHVPGLRDALTGTAPSLVEGAVRLGPWTAAWLHDGGA